MTSLSDRARHRRRLAFRESLIRFSFLLPTLAFFSFAVVIPFFLGFRVAFTNWDGITPSEMAKWVGLGNFAKVLRNADVLRPLGISIQYALLNTLGCNLFGLFVAIGVNRGYRFNRVHRMIFFMPVALSSVLAVFIWNFLYSNVLPSLLGMSNLLSGMTTVIPAVTLITVWAGTGITMLIYIAGLSSVPSSLYESARIDGAGAMRQFRHITVPMIMQAFTVNVTITFTSSLSSAGLFLAATHGGPAGSSEAMGLYIYHYLFKYNKAGYGQALAYLFMAFVILLGVLLSRVFRNREVEL